MLVGKKDLYCHAAASAFEVDESIQSNMSTRADPSGSSGLKIGELVTRGSF